MDTSLSKLSTPWTDEEVDTLIEHYRDCGPSWDGWGDVLPDRTHRAIVEKAHRLGVKCARPSAFRDYGGEPDLSAELAVSVLDDTTRLKARVHIKGGIGMSGGYFEHGYGGPYGVGETLNGQWRDEELNALCFDLFGGGWNGFRTPFGYKDRECEFGPRNGGLFESLDFWLSGDTCEEDYRDDVRRFKEKWLSRKTPRNRVEFYQRLFEEYATDLIEKFKEELTV